MFCSFQHIFWAGWASCERHRSDSQHPPICLLSVIIPFLVSLHPSRAVQSLLLLCWGTPLKAKQSCVRKNTARCEEMPRLAGNSRVRLLSAQSQAQMSSPKVFLSSYTSMCFISPSFPSQTPNLHSESSELEKF